MTRNPAHRLALPDAVLAYDSWGAGANALVCLHGGLGIDGAYLRVPAITGLASARRRVIVPDLRGHGASTRCGVDALSHEVWADDVRALAGHVARKPIALLGHSYGGFLALEFALRHPDALDRLVLVGTSAGPVRVDVPHARTDAGVAAFFRAQWPRFFAGAAKHGDVLARSTFAWEPFEAAFHRELPRYDVSARAGEIAAPALLVVGGEDPYRADMERLAARMPDARLVVIPRTGHMPFFEAPDAFRDAVGTFLDGR